MCAKAAEALDVTPLYLRRLALAAAYSLLVVASISARTQVLYSPDGTYAFPLAGNTSEMAWTHYHWDGGNAVDILPAPNLLPGTPAFAAFDSSPVVAVVSGRVVRADNDLGGNALLLFGDDGREYYYAHLSSTWVTAPTRVRVGDKLGVIGRTGRWARFIEIHLHFAISSTWHTGLHWKNDVNAARWIEKTFGLHWIDQNPITYPPTYPHGSPLQRPFRIVASFGQMKRANRDMASIRLQPLRVAAGARRSSSEPASGTALPRRETGAVPVYSTLGGAVRVMRATVLGLRLQITNLHTAQTVVYSGLESTQLRTGDVVNHGQIVGLATGTIGYMYFDHGALTDPTPTMKEEPSDKPSHAGSAGSLLN